MEEADNIEQGLELDSLQVKTMHGKLEVLIDKGRGIGGQAER